MVWNWHKTTNTELAGPPQPLAENWGPIGLRDPSWETPGDLGMEPVED